MKIWTLVLGLLLSSHVNSASILFQNEGPAYGGPDEYVLGIYFTDFDQLDLTGTINVFFDLNRSLNSSFGSSYSPMSWFQESSSTSITEPTLGQVSFNFTPFPGIDFSGTVKVNEFRFNISEGDFYFNFREVTGTRPGYESIVANSFSITAVPLPAAMPLYLLALATMGLIGRRQYQ